MCMQDRVQAESWAGALQLWQQADTLIRGHMEHGPVVNQFEPFQDSLSCGLLLLKLAT